VDTLRFAQTEAFQRLGIIMQSMTKAEHDEAWRLLTCNPSEVRAWRSGTGDLSKGTPTRLS
jgi:signal recognition particle GTPase